MKNIRFVNLRSMKAATILCVMALTLATGASNTQAALGFNPLHGVIMDTLIVSVTVDASVTDLRGFTWTLEFDPSIVIPLAVTPGPLVTGAACPNFVTWLNEAAVGDSIVVDGATLGCSVAGPGAIVELKFLGVGFGVSPLECRRSELRDSLNASIPHTCPDGTITRAVVGVESRPWTHVKRLFR